MMNEIDAEVFIKVARNTKAIREANDRRIEFICCKGFKMRSMNACEAIVTIQVENALLYEIQMLSIELMAALPEKHRDTFYHIYAGIHSSETRTFYRRQERMYKFCAYFLNCKGYQYEVMQQIDYARKEYAQLNVRKKRRYCNG